MALMKCFLAKSRVAYMFVLLTVIEHRKGNGNKNGGKQAKNKQFQGSHFPLLCHTLPDKKKRTSEGSLNELEMRQDLFTIRKNFPTFALVFLLTS